MCFLSTVLTCVNLRCYYIENFLSLAGSLAYILSSRAVNYQRQTFGDSLPSWKRLMSHQTLPSIVFLAGSFFPAGALGAFKTLCSRAPKFKTNFHFHVKYNYISLNATLSWFDVDSAYYNNISLIKHHIILLKKTACTEKNI